MKTQFVPYALALTLSFTVNSTVAAMTYTDEVAFTEALGGTVTTIESFETSPTDINATPLTFPTVDVSCDGSAWCSDFFGISTMMPTDGAQGVYFATPDSITFTFAAPVTAFAFDVGDLGTQGATDLSVTLSNGNSATLFTGYTGTSFSQAFIGLIDSTEFTSITFHGTVPDDGIYFDRMQTALVTVAPIPEPETYAMLLIGLSLIGIYTYRRKLQT